VEPDYLLGNIGETPLLELVASPRQRKFGRDKFDTLPKYCRTARCCSPVMANARATALARRRTAKPA